MVFIYHLKIANVNNVKISVKPAVKLLIVMKLLYVYHVKLEYQDQTFLLVYVRNNITPYKELIIVHLALQNVNLVKMELIVQNVVTLNINCLNVLLLDQVLH
jgi:hypothetical protein